MLHLSYGCGSSLCGEQVHGQYTRARCEKRRARLNRPSFSCEPMLTAKRCTSPVLTIWLADTSTVLYTASYVDLEILEEQTMERKDADTLTANEPKRRNIVCLYSQADEPFYLQLKKSLNLLERQEQVRWLEVLAGEELAITWQRNVK